MLITFIKFKSTIFLMFCITILYFEKVYFYIYYELALHCCVGYFLFCFDKIHNKSNSWRAVPRISLGLERAIWGKGFQSCQRITQSQLWGTSWELCFLFQTGLSLEITREFIRILHLLQTKTQSFICISVQSSTPPGSVLIMSWISILWS